MEVVSLLRAMCTPAGKWEYAWTNCGGLSYRAQADNQWAFTVNKYGKAQANNGGALSSCNGSTLPW